MVFIVHHITLQSTYRRVEQIVQPLYCLIMSDDSVHAVQIDHNLTKRAQYVVLIVLIALLAHLN